MSRICRFLPITVKEFRHKCQHYRQAGNNEQNLFNIVFVCLCKYVCSVAVESLKSNYSHQSGQFRNFGVWKATKFWKSRSKLNLPKSIVCTFPKLYNLVYQESCFETLKFLNYPLYCTHSRKNKVEKLQTGHLCYVPLMLSEIYIQIAPNNSNETCTFMCLGRAGCFRQC